MTLFVVLLAILADVQDITWTDSAPFFWGLMLSVAAIPLTALVTYTAVDYRAAKREQARRNTLQRGLTLQARGLAKEALADVCRIVIGGVGIGDADLRTWNQQVALALRVLNASIAPQKPTDEDTREESAIPADPWTPWTFAASDPPNAVPDANIVPIDLSQEPWRLKRTVGQLDGALWAVENIALHAPGIEGDADQLRLGVLLSWVASFRQYISALAFYVESSSPQNVFKRDYMAEILFRNHVRETSDPQSGSGVVRPARCPRCGGTCAACEAEVAGAHVRHQINQGPINARLQRESEDFVVVLRGVVWAVADLLHNLPAVEEVPN